MSSLPSSRTLRALLESLLLAVIGLGIGAGLVLGFAAVLNVAGVEISPLVAVVLSLVLVQGFAFGGVALGYLRRRGLGLEYLHISRPSLQDVLTAVGGYVLALTAALGGAILVSMTGIEAGRNQVAELGAKHPEVLLLLIPASYVFIGPGEELLFRGVIQSRLRETLDPVPAVLLASLIFAAIHYTALTGGAGQRLVTIALLFLPSLVFGSAYELTDNLVVPILIHATYNATLFTLLYLAVKLGQMQSQATLFV